MVDIIIPVYNTPIDDLERCLNSIKNQTYSDFNVIIVDDGSNVETALYLDDYSTDDNRFKVIHVKNGGVSKARNIGLDLAKSLYITFVDSDDVVKNSFLKEAMELITNNDLDIIIGGYLEINNDKVTRRRICEEGLHIYEGKDIIKVFDKLLSGKLTNDNLEIGDTPTGRIYTKLYRRDILKDIRFNENIKISEDTLFIIDLMSNLNRIGIVDKIWYKYYQNDYSIVHKKIGKEELNNLLDFMNEIYIRMIIENDKRVKNAYRMRIFKTCCDLEDILLRIDKDVFKNEIIMDSIKNVYLSSYINIKTKEKDFYDRMNNQS